MRKRILISILILTCLFTGCANNQQPDRTTIPETTLPTEITLPSEPTEAAILEEQKPMFTLSMPLIKDQLTEDDDILFEHVYQELDIIMPEPEIAERIILDYLNRTDLAEAAEQISQWAEDDYKDFPENWETYLCQATYEPMRFDSAILSLYGSHVRYAGINLAEGSNRAVTYDMTTGNVLNLTDVLTRISRDDLTQLLIDALVEKAEESELFEEYPDVIKARFSGSLEQEEDWYLSDDGLCFFFMPYEIAPRASGIVTVCIPYNQLAGKMDDAFFPPELDRDQGDVVLADFDTENMDRFTQIAEVILNEGGSQILLYTDLSVSNVRLELGDFEEGAFIPKHTVLSTPMLTPGDAIMLESSEANLKLLRLSYGTKEQTCYRFFQTHHNLVTAN